MPTIHAAHVRTNSTVKPMTNRRTSSRRNRAPSREQRREHDDTSRRTTRAGATPRSPRPPAQASLLHAKLAGEISSTPTAAAAPSSRRRSRPEQRCEARGEDRETDPHRPPILGGQHAAVPAAIGARQLLPALPYRGRPARVMRARDAGARAACSCSSGRGIGAASAAARSCRTRAAPRRARRRSPTARRSGASRPRSSPCTRSTPPPRARQRRPSYDSTSSRATTRDEPGRRASRVSTARTSRARG